MLLRSNIQWVHTHARDENKVHYLDAWPCMSRSRNQQVTIPISASIHARAMNFFVSSIQWVNKQHRMKIKCITWTRDLVRQGHVTNEWPFLSAISASIHARAMIFFVSSIQWVNKQHRMKIKCITWKRDLARQGHVTNKWPFLSLHHHRIIVFNNAVSSYVVPWLTGC